jgi:hypothetical protein
VSDRIALRLAGDGETVAAIRTLQELIAGETLATSLDAREAGSELSIELERA